MLEYHLKGGKIKKQKKNSSFHLLILPLPKINSTIMIKGTVKFFNETKGFGFITEDPSGKEHFVHVTGLIDDIKEGDEVEFELKEGKKGLNAINVKLIV